MDSIKYNNDYHSQSMDYLNYTASSLPPVLEKIVQKFQKILEPKHRYEYLLWFAKRLPELEADRKLSTNRVPGCASQVYVSATLIKGRVYFDGDSDALITKGLLGLLVEGLNGLTPKEILQITPDFIQHTGLDVSLTSSRVNGFYNIFQTIQKQVKSLMVEDLK